MWLYDFMGFFTLGSLVAIEVLGTIIYPLYVVIIMIYLLFARSDGDFGDEPDLDDDILHDPQDIDEEPQNLDDLQQAENITGSTFGPHQKFSRVMFLCNIYYVLTSMLLCEYIQQNNTKCPNTYIQSHVTHVT